MPWYYHTGNVVRPIRVAKGRSVAVRPHTKFEVFDESKEIQDLAARGVIRRTGGGPKSKTAPPPVPKIDPKDIPLPQFSKSIAEKGVTSGRGIPPKSKGPVEMTEGEAHAFDDGADSDDKKDKKGKK